MPLRPSVLARALVGAAVSLALLAPARADAQRITAACEVRDLAGCTTLRLDLAAADAEPWTLHALTATLGDGWRVGDGQQATVTGEDAFSFGTPFVGVASAVGGALFLDFLASPGFAFELTPGGAGWLRFDVRGAGIPTLVVTARDPDGIERGGAVVVDAPVSTVPEPSSVLLVGSGVLALAAAARRRAARAAHAARSA